MDKQLTTNLDYVLAVTAEISKVALEQKGLPPMEQLFEEVAELLLSLRGKHADTAELELLEIASLAMNLLVACSCLDVYSAVAEWHRRHNHPSQEPTNG